MLEIILLGLALSIDTFLICVPSGTITKKLNFFHILRISLIFAAFHIAMIVFGWATGSIFKNYILGYDHWVTSGILVTIGVKTIFDAFNSKETGDKKELNLAKLHHIFIIAFATSVDALAVGISFITFSKPIIETSMIIGLVNFLVSSSGLLLGEKIGEKIHEKLEEKIVAFGGLVLIIIGLKILFEHLR